MQQFTASQRKRLQEALVDAYPSVVDFQRLAQNELDVTDLDMIVPPFQSTSVKIAEDLVRWAMAQEGGIHMLLAAALRGNPGHGELQAIADAWEGIDFEVVLVQDERKFVAAAVTYIGNKGIFYAPHEWEHPKDTYDSAAEVRNKLTTIMEKLDPDTETYGRLETIRCALRDFQRALRVLKLTETPSKTYMSTEEVEAYDEALENLRYTSNPELKSLADRHGLELYHELLYWLSSFGL